MKTTIERNPDINLETESIPDGCYLQEGKWLMQTARFAEIPFGVAYRRQVRGGAWARVTHGLIIRESDRVPFNERLGRKEAKATQKVTNLI